jgi:hypothetical protein
VICLSDSEVQIVLPLNDSQQRTYLLRTLDPKRLARFKKALEKSPLFDKTRLLRACAYLPAKRESPEKSVVSQFAFGF